MKWDPYGAWIVSHRGWLVIASLTDVNTRRSRGPPMRERGHKPAPGQGLPADVVPHDLRDTAASLMIESGASIKAVQRALGNASAAMTLDTYGRLFEDDLKESADRMGERCG